MLSFGVGGVTAERLVAISTAAAVTMQTAAELPATPAPPCGTSMPPRATTMVVTVVAPIAIAVVPIAPTPTPLCFVKDGHFWSSGSWDRGCG